MIAHSKWAFAFLLAGWCCATVGFADDKPAAKPADKEEGAAEAKKTVKVEKGRLIDSVTLKERSRETPPLKSAYA